MFPGYVQVHCHEGDLGTKSELARLTLETDASDFDEETQRLRLGTAALYLNGQDDTG